MFWSKGTIKKIGEVLKGEEYIEAEGAYVIPGGIDLHTHPEMPFMDITGPKGYAHSRPPGSEGEAARR